MSLYERHSSTHLEEPVLVVAMEGWMDAGMAAAGAIAALLGDGSTTTVADFDDEALIDQRARRPIAHFVDGVNEKVMWPQIELLATQDRQGLDFCCLIGPEPDFRWQSFVPSIVELASELRVRMVVGLGAFPAAVPHTRPVRVAATAAPGSTELARRIGVVSGTLDVPAGIWSVLEHGFDEVGLPAVGLWARVPHYVAGMPFPAASAALLEGLGNLSGLTFDLAPLRTAADASLRQVDELIARSSEHADLVSRLEESLDTSEGNPLDLGELPTGDELAAELERYLSGERGESGPTDL